MAKRKTRTLTVTRAASPVIRVQTPAPVVSRARRVGRAARRAGSAIGRASDTPVLAAAVAGYALGSIRKNKVEIPSVMGMGPTASATIIAYGVAKLTSGELARYARSLATGGAAIVAYMYALEGEVVGHQRGVAASLDF